MGLSAAVVLSADRERAGPHDTFALASAAMATHAMRYNLSSAIVLHFFGVSYAGVEGLEWKQRKCAELLELVRWTMGRGGSIGPLDTRPRARAPCTPSLVTKGADR